MFRRRAVLSLAGGSRYALIPPLTRHPLSAAVASFCSRRRAVLSLVGGSRYALIPPLTRHPLSAAGGQPPPE